MADSELKEVNLMLEELQSRFDSHMATIQDDTRSQVAALDSLIKEIGRKCRDVQETLKGVPQSPTSPAPTSTSTLAPEVRGMDYSHSITVDETSPAPAILAEYREIKGKFDRAVAELKKLRKELNDVYSCYDQLEQQDKALKEQFHSMELSYKQRLEELVSRVEALTFKVDLRHQKPVSTASAHPADSASTSAEIERHIEDLDRQLSSLEKSLVEKTDARQTSESSKAGSVSSPLSVEESSAFVATLREMKEQLDATSARLQSSPTGKGSSSLQSHISQCGQKINSLTSRVEETAKIAASAGCCDEGGCDSEEEEEEEGARTTHWEAAAVNKCLLDVKDRILEIGEQLDALDEETDSEDEDDEEEETTIEAVRGRLAGILEYIEQHARLTARDWRVLGLVRSQQEEETHQQVSQTEMQAGADQQLQLYRDRLSLEAVILGEMAFLLQNLSSSDSHDRFLQELNVLNSQIITLHQQLETETRSMCMTDAKEDVLTSYAALLAEKIVLEGKLTATEEEAEEEGEEEGEKVSSKPTILAAEALLRSQLDSFISAGLDKSLGDMEPASSHIVTKALVQGELTYALHRMREKLGAEESKGGNKLAIRRDFAYQEMKKRMAMVEDLVGAYKVKMVHALAVIITKDTEEMTIVEGPESLLEGICSEISTCMEKHIQSFKEKMRSAASHPEVARKAELAVNSLRALREVVLCAIKQEHQAYNSQDHDGEEHEEVQVPFQSLDATINNFGEILSQQAIVSAGLDYLQELYESGLEDSLDSDSSFLEDREPATDIDKSMSIFVRNLSDAIKEEAAKKRLLSTELAKRVGERDQGAGRDTNEYDPEVIVLNMPSVEGLSSGLRTYSAALVREAVFQAQLTYTSYKIRLQHQQELEQLKHVFPGARKSGLVSQDSAEMELDVQSLLLPLEEVLDTKYEDECQVLSVLQRHCSQLQEVLTTANLQQVEEMVRQLEQTFVHEVSRAQERHETHLELFKQEAAKVEAKWEERERDRDAYEGRCAELEDHLQTLQTEHDEEMDRMRQDIMTAVSAIRANEEQSETQLADQVHRLTMQLAAQRESFKTFLEGVKRESGGKLSTKTIERAEEQLSLLEQGIIPEPLPKLLDDEVTDGAEAADLSASGQEMAHVQELEQLRREKEEALAEEVRNTKAALEAMKKAYEEDLSAEKEKYREALVTMYTDDYISEIRHRHEYEVEKLKDEVKQLSLHYSSKCEDYKLLEMKLQQTKTDYDSHIEQLIKSNGHLEQLVNQEIEKIKEHIQNKEPSHARPSSNHTLEEELSDAQIMIRVKDAELQKLRSQVKNLENSLQRTTEEHRQTMTQHLQLMKQHGEMQTAFKKEKTELHDRIDQLMESMGSRRPIRRTPSFHARARSPSPQASPSQKDKSEHASRDSHRKRHIAPKDLRRSKSSPSLPYVFDAKRPGTRDGAGGRRPSACKTPKY